MEITSKCQDNVLTVTISGKLDTLSAPKLEASLAEEAKDVHCLVLDLAAMPYISSAGLRIVLRWHKIMKEKGGLSIIHANEVVMETFTMTGFAGILHFEN